MKEIEAGQKLYIAMDNQMQEQGIVLDFDETWIELLPINYDGKKKYTSVIQLRREFIRAILFLPDVAPEELEAQEDEEERRPMDYEQLMEYQQQQSPRPRLIIPDETLVVQESDPVLRAREIARQKASIQTGEVGTLKAHMARGEPGRVNVMPYGAQIEMFSTKKHSR